MSKQTQNTVCERSLRFSTKTQSPEPIRVRTVPDDKVMFMSIAYEIRLIGAVLTTSYCVNVRSPAEMVQEKSYSPDTGETNSPAWTENSPPSFKRNLSKWIAWCSPRFWRLWERWAWKAPRYCSPCGSIRLSSTKFRWRCLNTEDTIPCLLFYRFWFFFQLRIQWNNFVF